MLGVFSAGSVYTSGEESKAPQIVFGPAGADEEIANDVGGRRIIGPMVMDYHTPAIRVAIRRFGSRRNDTITCLVYSWPVMLE